MEELFRRSKYFCAVIFAALIDPVATCRVLYILQLAFSHLFPRQAVMLIRAEPSRARGPVQALSPWL